MGQVRLKDGFTLDIDESFTESIRFLDTLVDIKKGDPVAYAQALRIVLGDEKERLYAHLEETEGKATYEAVTEVFTEIMEAVSAKK